MRASLFYLVAAFLAPHATVVVIGPPLLRVRVHVLVTHPPAARTPLAAHDYVLAFGLLMTLLASRRCCGMQLLIMRGARLEVYNNEEKGGLTPLLAAIECACAPETDRYSPLELAFIVDASL